METNKRNISKYLLIIFGFMLSVCSTSMFAHDNEKQGAVYAMSNKADGNEILVYDRKKDGALSFSDTYPTGGLGTGGEPPIEPVDALGSQSPLILSRDNKYLFAVNAESDNITVFRINRKKNTLTRTDIADSNGEFPVSLTIHDDILYVLNSGGSASISGFEFDSEDGLLTPIPGSTQPLDFVGDDSLPRFLVSPAQISFDKEGERLVVTVKGSNSIHVFSVNDDGQADGARVTTQSNGRTPFGFGFDRRGHLLVAEAFGSGDLGQAGVSAVTSYTIAEDNTLEVISPSVPNFQTASCWLMSNRHIPFAYTTNNGSDTISGYKIRKDGSISLLNASGVAANTELAPVDLALTRKGRFLYAVNAGYGTISMFRVNTKTGDLSSLGDIGGLPVDDGAVGIAAR